MGINKHKVILVDCFGFNGPLRQYFSPYRAVSQRGNRNVKMNIFPTKKETHVVDFFCFSVLISNLSATGTVELYWLEHLRDHVY